MVENVHMVISLIISDKSPSPPSTSGPSEPTPKKVNIASVPRSKSFSLLTSFLPQVKLSDMGMRDKSSLETHVRNLLFPYMNRILQSAEDERLNTMNNIVKPGLLTFDGDVAAVALARIFAEVGRLPYTSSEEKAAVNDSIRHRLNHLARKGKMVRQGPEPAAVLPKAFAALAANTTEPAVLMTTFKALFHDREEMRPPERVQEGRDIPA